MNDAFDYYCALDWYDSDVFDNEIYSLLSEKVQN